METSESSTTTTTQAVGDNPLYIETPTIHSIPLSKIAGYPVYLKLENLQIPGSFKQRGISNFCKKAIAKGAKRIVCASGGNAGMAAAYCAKLLHIPAVIVLPTTTPKLTADRLRDMGATVEVRGDVWNESNDYAKTLATNPDCVYVHPFDHPDVWEGHSSLILEAANQMPGKPDVVIASVGGGGLLNGVLQGMWKVGWNDVPVIAMETIGADSFNAAVKAGKQVALPAITSIAKTLGSLMVNETCLEYSKRHKVLSALVSDREAVSAILNFSNDHRMLVEPSCGASLAAIYSDIVSNLQSEEKLGPVTSALVVVCGGSNLSLDTLQKWKTEFGL